MESTLEKGSASKKIKIINANGKFCNKFGNNANNATIQDVKFSKDSALNLFGIGRFLKEGCCLGGNRRTGIFIKKKKPKDRI